MNEAAPSPRQESQRSDPYYALALDGGGMRGLYSAFIVRELIQRFTRPSGKETDFGAAFSLIAGTSTGGILALGLAAGISIDRIIELYRTKGRLIFKHPLPNNPALRIIWMLRHLFRTSSNARQLHDDLKCIFGNETLGDLFSRRSVGVCIPAVRMDTEESRVFKTPHDPKRTADQVLSIVDVCMATSAAPVYMPLASVRQDLDSRVDYFVDGGLWANNPVVVVLLEAMMQAGDRPIRILSIGTCAPSDGSVLTPKQLNRGVWAWLGGIKSLMLSMNAQASGSSHIARLLATTLQSRGMDIRIERLSSQSPNPQQRKYLNLDAASETAMDVLCQMGQSDGRDAHSRSLDPNDPQGKFIRELFENLPYSCDSSGGESNG